MAKNVILKPLKPILKQATSFKGAPAAQLAEGMKELVTAWKDYKTTCEVESTKRTQIQAWKETQLSKIQAQERLVDNYLAGIFKERHEVFAIGFQRLDAALRLLSKKPNDEGAMKGVDAALTVIVGQIRESPLLGLNDLMRSMEDDAGTMHI